MLDTLEKMSGIRHESYRESKSVTFDAKKLINPSDSKVTETTNIKEKPVISKNDMLLIPKANEMVFGKGDPIWNRNQMALPMAWRLHMKMPHASGVEGYQLNTVPSSSNTDDFDILGNQPNFFDMVAKRCKQARIAKQVYETYKNVYGLSEDKMHRIKPDELAQQLMAGINENLTIQAEAEAIQKQEDADVDDDDVLDAISQQDYIGDMQNVADDANNDDGTSALSQMLSSEGDALQDSAEENTEFTQAHIQQQQQADTQSEKRYARNSISREDLMSGNLPNDTTFGPEISQAYSECINNFKQDPKFRVSDDGALYSQDGSVPYIELNSDETSQYGQDSQSFDAGADGNVTTLANGHVSSADEAEVKYHPTTAFYQYLISLDNWDDIAGGTFDLEMFNAFTAWEQNE